MDGIWFFYLILAAFPALIVFAAVYKYMEVTQAARWPRAQGRVVVSTSEVRQVRSGGPNACDTEPRTFAKIVYEFSVAGRKYRGNRVSIGEDMGNFQVAETIAKYPCGKDVFVYYNPRRPTEAVLERELPPGIWKGVTIVVVVLVGLIVGSIVGFNKLGDFVRGIVRNPGEAPFVTACVGFALLAALVIWAIVRNAARQRSWPVVAGRIESSGAREFQERDDRRWRTRYRAEIVYSYEVAGVRYTADKSATGVRISSVLESFARKAAEPYPAGAAVEVHYNPDNPAESAIDPKTGWLLLLWLIPVAMLALAYSVGR
jgi:hypothetical protein